MRLMMWVAVLVAVGWGISLAMQQFLQANPRPTF